MNTKICKTCKVEKPISEYYINNYFKDKVYYGSNCKPCANKIRLQRDIDNPEAKYKRNCTYGRNLKRKLVQLFGGKCLLCEGIFHPSAYDFHHTNPREKERPLNQIKSFAKAIEETKKCIMLCSNCHRTIHSELDFYL